MDKTQNWKILVGFLGVVVVGIIIYIATKSSSGSSSGSGSSSDSNESRRKSKPIPNPNPNPNKPCFVPEEQKSSCMHLTPNDTIEDEFKCLPWRPDILNTGGCDMLYSTYREGGDCAQESKDVYDHLCNSSNDPVIHNRNNDRNNNPCPGDCQRDSDKLLSCYVRELQSANDACEFKSKTNTGPPLQNCINYGNMKSLYCVPELTTACQNVLSRMPPQCGK